MINTTGLTPVMSLTIYSHFSPFISLVASYTHCAGEISTGCPLSVVQISDILYYLPIKSTQFLVPNHISVYLDVA